jgi:hypothetical protein
MSGFTTIPEEERKEKWDYHQANKGPFKFNFNPFKSPLKRGGIPKELGEEMVRREDERVRREEEEAERKRNEPYARMRMELEDLMKDSETKEMQLKEEMIKKASESTKAVNALLESLMEQTGYNTGLMKQAASHSAAERGVLRSGQTASRLEGVDYAGAAQKTRLIDQRNQQVRQIRSATEKAQKQVQDRRFEIEQQLRQAEMLGMQDLAYQEKIMNISMKTKQLISDMDLSSLATKNLLGGLEALGTLAGVGIGYNMEETPQKDIAVTPGTPRTPGTSDYGYGYNDIGQGMA